MKNAVPPARPSGVIGPCAGLAVLLLLLAATPLVSGQIVATAPNAAALERFEEGIELVAQDETGEAIRIFEELTHSYPDWPEPHNNLAVLYAARGEEKKAEQALLAALNAHPSYSLVYQNLRTLYADMAGRAYRKALQSDAGETGALSLALAENLVAPETQSPDTSAITVAAMGAPRLAPEPVAEPADPEPIVEPAPVVVAAVPEPLKKSEPVAAAAPEPVAKAEPVRQPAAPEPVAKTEPVVALAASEPIARAEPVAVPAAPEPVVKAEPVVTLIAPGPVKKAEPVMQAAVLEPLAAPRAGPEKIPMAEPAVMPDEPEVIAKADPVSESVRLRPAAELVPPPEPGIDMARDILDIVDSWAAAWADQDAARYLGFYGHHFVPENDVPRSRWEEVRRIRVTAPDYIEVRVHEPSVDLQDDRTATVRFLQVYRSNTFVGRTIKTLRVSRGRDGWKIIRERVGG
jgi:hypothetical protein